MAKMLIDRVGLICIIFSIFHIMFIILHLKYISTDLVKITIKVL